MPDPMHRRAVVLALIVTVLWSSSWVIIKLGMDDQGLRPITFAGLRYSAAALVLLGVTASRPAARSAMRSVTRSEMLTLIALGVVLYAVAQSAQFIALDLQPAASTGLVLAMTPLLVMAASQRSLAETPARRHLAGGVLVAIGAVLYFSGALEATGPGMTAALVCLAANAGGALLGRSANRAHHTSPLVVTTVSMSVGAILMLGTGIAIEGVPALTTIGVLMILWLAVANTALGFTLWNASLRHLTAGESAVINNTMLVQIALAAWIFLDEAPGPLQIVGILLVTYGVVHSQRG